MTVVVRIIEGASWKSSSCSDGGLLFEVLGDAEAPAQLKNDCCFWVSTSNTGQQKGFPVGLLLLGSSAPDGGFPVGFSL